jgi:hypothetical protein
MADVHSMQVTVATLVSRVVKVGSDSCNKLLRRRQLCPIHSGAYIPDWRRLAMQGETKERWMELCEQAAVEQDTEKLMKLIEEINRMLDDKDERLKRAQSLGSK